METLYVIGGGPSGMMCAISAKSNHPDLNVVLLERNKQLGEKLKLTGGGRCNVTADVSNEQVIQSTIRNGKFLFSALQEFNTQDIQDFFNSRNCELKVENHNRVFPKSNEASDIILTLIRSMREVGVEVIYDTKIETIDQEKKQLIASDATYNYDYVVIASGGMSYRETGSDGSGFELAKILNHKIMPLSPAEVPLVSNDTCIQSKELQGLGVKDASVSVLKKGKVKQTIRNDILFTHFGLSGPAALQVSSYVIDELNDNKQVQITLDFVPDVSVNELMQKTSKQDIKELLLLHNIPKRLIRYIESVSETKEEWVSFIKNFPLTIYTTRGFSNAFVTRGGVCVKEVDPKTMKSKLDDNFSFCGEVLDMNAFTGGYNMTIAFVTGYVAGKYIK